jgi:hypothetical protein
MGMTKFIKPLESHFAVRVVQIHDAETRLNVHAVLVERNAFDAMIKPKFDNSARVLRTRPESARIALERSDKYNLEVLGIEHIREEPCHCPGLFG